MTERKQFSLLTRTTLMIIGGVVMAMLFSMLLTLLSRWAINTFYMSENAVRARNEALAQDLQQFVTEHHLASDDYEDLNRWLNSGKRRELFVYEGNVVYDAGSREDRTSSVQEMDEEALEQRGYATFRIRFANGTRRTIIADESDRMLRSNLRTIMIVASFLLFAGTLLMYMRRITRYMLRFSEDVTAVSSGEAERVNEKRGFSELSGIARDVNHMHDVITERTNSAQQALQANRDLITALSHDIRTPLTALIAYLELLSMDGADLTDTQRQYLDRSTEKAGRIRELTDEMFRYFLIFSDDKPQTTIEPFDAQILLQQMLGEYAIELIEQGYTVETNTLQTPCAVYADVGMLRHVMDNLFSNIRKYADPEKPVRLSAYIRNGELHIVLENTVRSSPQQNVESNRIGLRTCAAIMEMLSGSITTEQTDGSFTVDLMLPLAPDAQME